MLDVVHMMIIFQFHPVRIYDRISFLQREIIDNETHRWEGRDADIESTFRSVCRWCYKSIK